MTFLRESKYGFKREELACTNLNQFKREFLLLPRFSLKSNHLETTWTHTSHTQNVFRLTGREGSVSFLGLCYLYGE